MGGPGACRIDYYSRGDGFAAAQQDRLDAIGDPLYGDDLVVDVVDTVVDGFAAQPIHHGEGVECALVDGVEAAGHDVVKMVERVGRRDLFSGEHPGAGAAGGLQRLIAARDVGEVLVVGEVEVAEIADRDVGDVRGSRRGSRGSYGQTPRRTGRS